MKGGIVKLAGARDHQYGVEKAQIGELVEVYPDDENYGGLLLCLKGGSLIGTLSEHSWVAKRLEKGELVLHASVSSFGEPIITSSYEIYSPINVRIVTGSPADVVTITMTAFGPDDRPRKIEEGLARRYPVNLVGEANFQSAIRACTPGDRVDVMHEIGNPYDDKALAVVTGDGATIGYIAKSSWLRDAIHDEEQGCDASIQSIARAEGGTNLGVVLAVTLTDDILTTRTYDR